MAQPAALRSTARPMLTTLSAITASPTQQALIAATAQTVSPLYHANTSFTSGTPFLAVAEPAFPLLTLAFEIFSRAIGNADAFDPLGFCGGLVLGGVECGVGCHQARHASKPCLMRLDSGDQQVAIIRPMSIDLII